MITNKIKDIGIKLLNYRIKKIQSKIDKPIKNFDDGISRAKDLISIGNLKEAENILISLDNIERKAFEKISSDASLSSEFIDKFSKESEKKQKRIENLLSLIKSRKLGVAFTNIDNFGYIDAIKIIKKNIKDGNFVDARLFLMKLKQKEKNYFEILIRKNSTNFFKKAKYTYIYREKLENFIELDISIFYNENFSKIYKFSNLKSLIKILKIIIDNKDWDFFDKTIPEIKSFEENILSEIQNNSYLSYFYKRKSKSRFNLILKILKKLYKIYYKEKTGLSIELSQVKSIDDTFIVINDFLRAYNFDNALKALYELKDKETSFFEGVLGDQSIDKKFKDKLLKRFRKFENKIKGIENKINKKKQIYDKKAHLSDLRIRNNQLNKQLEILLNQKDFDNGLELINNYKKDLGDDLDKYIVSLEKWKFKILKLKEKNLNTKKDKKNILEEAKNLLGEDFDEELYKDNIEEIEIDGAFSKFKNFYKKYKFFKKQREDKFLLANIESLLGNSKNIKESVIKQKLEKVHSGLVKDTSGLEMNGYSIFGKTLGSDNISGDTFGFFDYKNGKRFFIGDATGHGIKAGFMISLLTSNFYNLVSKFDSLKDLVVELNNKLKQDLKSGNFITSIFFALSYEDKNKIHFIGMGHEPMFFYKKESLSTSKIFPGGIAAGMTILKDQAFLKEKELIMNDGDTLLLYTDGIVESRNKSGEMYSINRLQEKFQEACRNFITTKEIYDFIYKDLSDFTSGSKFFDDVTIIIIKRDKKKDSINEETIIENILESEKLSKKYVKNLKGKSKDEIEKFLKSKRKERELDSILKNLKNTFKSGDIIVLKKECQRYIKEGFIHKDIVKYLSYSIDNEAGVKINQQNMRLQNKYETLEKLLKNGQYKTVLEECSAIILNDGKI